MKIAYLTTRFPKLSESFIYNEINVLRDLGMDIRIYSSRRPLKKEAFSYFIKYIGNTFYIIPPKIIPFIFSHFYWLFRDPINYISLLFMLIFQPNPSLKDRIFTIFNFLEGVYLANRLIADRIKHIHVHLSTGAVIVALVASKLAKLNYSLTAHGSATIVNPILLNVKIKNSKFVITVSNYNREYIIKKVGKHISKKIHVLHCGVDTEVFKPVCKTKSNPKALQFLTVGRLIWQKAQHIMIESFAYLISNGINARLRIIGEGPCKAFLEKKINQLNLQNEVILVGAKPPDVVKKEYDNADIFVLSSISEGIPISLMEAMSCGIPVIATRITGISELVDDGKNGILVNPNDPGMLAGAMINLAEDTVLRRKLGSNARLKIKQNFDIHRNVFRLFLLFKTKIPLCDQRQLFFRVNDN